MYMSSKWTNTVLRYVYNVIKEPQLINSLHNQWHDVRCMYLEGNILISSRHDSKISTISTYLDQTLCELAWISRLGDTNYKEYAKALAQYVRRIVRYQKLPTDMLYNPNRKSLFDEDNR